MSNNEKKLDNPWKSFITGGFGGVCNICVGFPFDTMKVRLQTMPIPQPGQKPMYSGMFDCIMKTIRNEGIGGLYKGISVPIVGVVPVYATFFAGYSVGKRLQQRNDQIDLNYMQLYVAGMFSGLFTTLVIAPGERIKCILQTQKTSGADRKYTGIWDTLWKLYLEGGVRNVYRGTCATLLRDLPGNGLYFLVYEFIQNCARRRSLRNEISTISTILAGGSAGVAFWVFSMPSDVLKSRLQTAPAGKYKHGVRSVFVEIMKTDGPSALYKGVVPAVIRAFPAHSACFFGIELANKFFNRIAPNF